MNHPIELVEQQAIPTLSVRRRSAVENLPAVLGAAYGEVMQYGAMSGAQVEGPAFVIYYNMDMQDLDIEIGFICKIQAEGGDGVAASTLPAGRYVTAVHLGAYSAMVPLYEAMNGYMAEKGLEPSGEAVELYYNSPMEVPESQLKTKVMLRVKE